MGYRYCPECEQWYETSEYTVDDHGETVCRKDDHGATHGFIIDAPWSEREFLSEHPSWYGEEERQQMLAQAKEQGLVA